VTVFKDQKQFMDVTGQKPSKETVNLYMRLIHEEFKETQYAWRKWNDDQNSDKWTAEMVDGAIDLIYVATGMIHALGLDPQPFWDEVQRSNMSKFDKGPDGEYIVTRRVDGKILKGPNYFKPDLLRIVYEQSGARS